ncbi:protein of unknown function [Thauera humireducens]|nr:protein of unknown function [Thauera humireducens]
MPSGRCGAVALAPCCSSVRSATGAIRGHLPRAAALRELYGVGFPDHSQCTRADDARLHPNFPVVRQPSDVTSAQVFAWSVPLASRRTDRMCHVADLHHQAAHLVECKFPLSAAARVHRRVDALDDLRGHVVAAEGLDELEHRPPGSHHRLVHWRAVQPTTDRIEAQPHDRPVVVAVLGLCGARVEAPALPIACVHRDSHHDGVLSRLVLLLGDDQRAARTVGEADRHYREGKADRAQIRVETTKPIVEEPAARWQREVLRLGDGAHDREGELSTLVAGGGELLSGDAERTLDLGRETRDVHSQLRTTRRAAARSATCSAENFAGGSLLAPLR